METHSLPPDLPFSLIKSSCFWIFVLFMQRHDGSLRSLSRCLLVSLFGESPNLLDFKWLLLLFSMRWTPQPPDGFSCRLQRHGHLLASLLPTRLCFRDLNLPIMKYCAEIDDDDPGTIWRNLCSILTCSLKSAQN